MTTDQIQQTGDGVPDYQATAILDLLSRWLGASPGRRVAVELTSAGWRATLSEPPAVTTHNGESMADALAQIAQIAAFEVSQ